MGVSRVKSVVVVAVLALFASVLPSGLPPAPAQAAEPANFNPGLIISDENFYDRWAMSVNEIQGFLQSNIGTCLNSNCLNVVRVNSAAQTADAMCDATAGGTNESAAEIIYKVQVACSISARVLLVTLQKEQSLVTSTAPSASKLDRATGYACPDSANGECDPAYVGLFNQIYLAAWQFKRYGNPPGTSNFFNWFPVGRPSSILYNPNANQCGSSTVTVQNRATAALYYYTPYQPNPAALANLYGTGDDCSAYGNRNFWRLYTDWFGNPVLPAGTPTGEVKDLWTDSNAIKLWGWAVDLDDRKTSLAVHVKVDDTWYAWAADAPNSTAETLYPGSGQKHGFGGVISASPGQHRVCVYAVNVGRGANLQLTCRDVIVPDGSPVGELKDLWATSGTVNFWGWAADRDDLAGNVQIHVSANGKWGVYRADQPYPAATGALPGVGPRSGFGGTMTLPPGSTTVCVYAVNVGAGVNTTLGCKTLTVPDGSPVGQWKDATSSANAITVWGWASDPDDQAARADVHLRVDDTWYRLTADGYYPGAASGLGGDADRHGWGAVLPAAPGTHSVCAWAINVGAGANLDLGCRQVTVALPVMGTGAVAVRGPSSELLAGAVVEVRSGDCAGAPVWRATTGSKGDATGAFGIGLPPGAYCVAPLSVPVGYGLPQPFLTEVAPGAGNWITVWAPTAVTGAVVAKDGSGAGIDGVTVQITAGSCASSGQAVWLNTTATGQWSSGGFGISLAPGAYCLRTTAVPAGFLPPAPLDVTVASPSPVWLTVWLDR